MSDKPITEQELCVEPLILELRGRRVIIDADLGRIYGTTTKRLNQAVRRNRERFPSDFMFELSVREKLEVVANCDHLNNLKHSTQLPSAFTEHGAIMAASVLDSPQAIAASLLLVRVFIRLREILASGGDRSQRLDLLEHKVATHDQALTGIVKALRRLQHDPLREARQIGFRKHETDKRD